MTDPCGRFINLDQMLTGPTKLKDFIARTGLSRDKVAEALQVSRTVVYFWLEKGVVPKLVHRRAIAVWSGNEVPVDAWDQPSEVPTVEPFAGELKPPAESDEVTPTPGAFPSAGAPSGS